MPVSKRKRKVEGRPRDGRPAGGRISVVDSSLTLRGRLARTSLVLAAMCLAVAMLQRCFLPALGTDAMIYHLTLPAQWLQYGLLADVDLPFHDAAAEHSPMLTQIISYLLMRLAGDDGLNWLLQPLLLAAALRLFYRSARLLEAPRPTALLLTAVVGSYGPFVLSSPMANNDMALLCGASLLLYGLVLGGRRPAAGLIWGAAGMALMLATKFIGVIYAAAGALLLLPVLVASLRPGISPAGNSRGGAAARRGLLRRLGPILASAVIVAAGSFFLLRNWAIYGNPLYPSTVRLGGQALFGGLYEGSVLVNHGFAPAALMDLFLYGQNQFSPRPPFSVVMLASTAVCLVLPLLSRRDRRWSFFAPTAAFPLVAGLLFLAVTPFWQQHRLLYPVYYAMLLAVARACGPWLRASGSVPRLHPAAAAAFDLLLAMVLVWQMYLLGWCWEVWFWLCLMAAVVVGNLRWPRRPWRRVCLPAAGAAALLALLGSPLWYPAYAEHRRAIRGPTYASYYGHLGAAWALVDRESRTRPRTVAYSSSAMVYPLFGPRLANRVFYVPLSPQDRPQPVSLSAADSLYRRLALQRRACVDELYWLQGLRRRQVDLLCLVDDPGLGGVQAELQIIGRHPELFQEIPIPPLPDSDPLTSPTRLFRMLDSK